MGKAQAQAQAQAQASPTPPTIGAYAEFIGQIELKQLWLRSATIENAHGPETPEQTTIQVAGDGDWEPTPDGFRATQSYRLRFQAGQRVMATIDVRFSVDYASETPMDEGIFSLFRDANLPVNAWPYLREFVATTVGRMGWLPVTLPALKIGAQTAKPTKPAKSRRPKTKPSTTDDKAPSRRA